MKTVGTVVTAVALLLFIVAKWTGAFDPKSPLLPEALDQLKAFVENDGYQVPAVDVFSVPGSGVSSTAAVDTVKVSRIKYLYPVPDPSGSRDNPSRQPPATP